MATSTTHKSNRSKSRRAALINSVPLLKVLERTAHQLESQYHQLKEQFPQLNELNDYVGAFWQNSRKTFSALQQRLPFIPKHRSTTGGKAKKTTHMLEGLNKKTLVKHLQELTERVTSRLTEKLNLPTRKELTVLQKTLKDLEHKIAVLQNET